MKIIFAALVLYCSIVSAQVTLKIVLPERDTTRYGFTRHRVAGSTTPGNRMFVNGIESNVNRIGAWIGMVNVPEGTSTVRFVARNPNGDSTVIAKTFIRPLSPAPTPRDPLTIKKSLMLPSEDLWLGEGDVLEVRFKGSPGYDASFDIPDVESGIPMHELNAKNASDMEGIYRGRYIIKAGDETHDAHLRFRLKKNFWSSEKTESKASVTITTNEFPRVVELKGKRPYLNIGLGSDRLGGAKLGYLQSGVRMKVTGKFGDQYRVQLSPSMTAYLPEESADLHPAETPLPRSLSSAISVSGTDTPSLRSPSGASAISGTDAIDQVTIGLNQKLPYTTEQQVDPAAVIVNIFGATSNTNWITHYNSASNIDQVTVKQIATEHMQVTILLKDQQHWGYDASYENGSTLKVKIRRAPVVADTSRPLAGLKIAIDAGHGGDNYGALSSTGALEKDVNLSIARHLNELLKSKGVQTILTRDRDANISMDTRTDTIIGSGARILVSIHNNSIGESSDAATAKGTSAYWRYPGFKSLADILYAKMLETGLSEYGRTGSFNFALNAPTQCVNALIEVGFMSNPDDELNLLDDNFRMLVAQKIASGLEEFMLQYASRK
ncbi:MAG TPA: N-acetylmuramoyl-L-alanine amidase [Bacteroidota bacterium]|nr:N-acetylmuramoyl-L-alanine amidase [Bacteroidota bacterium]